MPTGRWRRPNAKRALFTQVRVPRQVVLQTNQYLRCECECMRLRAAVEIMCEPLTHHTAEGPVFPRCHGEMGTQSTRRPRNEGENANVGGRAPVRSSSPFSLIATSE